MKFATFKFQWSSTIVCFLLFLSTLTALTIWIFLSKQAHPVFLTILPICLQIFPAILQTDASCTNEFVRDHAINSEWHVSQPLISHSLKICRITYAHLSVCCFEVLMPQKLALVSFCAVDPESFSASAPGPKGRTNSRKASVGCWGSSCGKTGWVHAG